MRDPVTLKLKLTFITGYYESIQIEEEGLDILLSIHLAGWIYDEFKIEMKPIIKVKASVELISLERNRAEKEKALQGDS